MPKEAGINQKLKLMYLAKYFNEETDEEHPLTVYELSDKLEADGITANRKTLSEDIALLCDFGMDIITVKSGRSNGYYLGERDFEIPELKLLADAVSSARFITEKKSRQLLKKISALAGKFHGQEINRRVFIADRVKSGNEHIYINVDTIQRAIDCGCKITFRYFTHGVDKKRIYSDDKICSPYALTWNDSNYYLIAYYTKYPNKLSHFRVDRMDCVEILDEKAVGIPDGFNLAEYMNTTFSMFSGIEQDIKLRFDNSLVSAVIDKFGMEAILVPDGDKHFIVNEKIKPGAAFYGWIFQFGEMAEILSPESIRREFADKLKSINSIYNDTEDFN